MGLNINIIVVQDTNPVFTILSRARGVGSSTNHPGSGQ